MNHGPAPCMGRGLGHSLFLVDARHRSFKSNSLNSYWLAPLWTLHSVFNSHWVKSLSSQSALSKELTVYSDCFIVPLSWVMPRNIQIWQDSSTHRPLQNVQLYSKVDIYWPPKNLFLTSCFCFLSNHSFAEIYPLLHKYDSIKKKLLEVP